MNEKKFEIRLLANLEGAVRISRMPIFGRGVGAGLSKTIFST